MASSESTLDAVAASMVVDNTNTTTTNTTNTTTTTNNKATALCELIKRERELKERIASFLENNPDVVVHNAASSINQRRQILSLTFDALLKKYCNILTEVDRNAVTEGIMAISEYFPEKHKIWLSTKIYCYKDARELFDEIMSTVKNHPLYCLLTASTKSCIEAFNDNFPKFLITKYSKC